jgi:hypothetical protein
MERKRQREREREIANGKVQKEYLQKFQFFGW